MNSLIGQELGHYRITEQLGEGGMAVVYKAFDTHLERDVAVKVIRIDQFAPAMLEKILKRFEREAKLLGKLSHPNIISVIDYGEYENIPYLVMAYLSGGTLKERLGKPISVSEAANILLPVARALDYAHRQGMVHRDVKPSNILITSEGEPMLTDFGIAKLLESDEGQTLTGTGVGIGTPEYMAPEQWLGQATQASDQYSLGVIFYEMITGQKPFTAETPAAILLKQANDPLPSPRKTSPEISEEAERFIYKAMARDPHDRYPDMGVFCEALQSMASARSSRSKLAAAVSTIPSDEPATIDEGVLNRVDRQPDISKVTTESPDAVLSTRLVPPPILDNREMPPPISGQYGSMDMASKTPKVSIFKDKKFWLSFGLFTIPWFLLGILVGEGIYQAYILGRWPYASVDWLYNFGLLICGLGMGLSIHLRWKMKWFQIAGLAVGFPLLAYTIYKISFALIPNNPLLANQTQGIAFALLSGVSIGLMCLPLMKLKWWHIALIAFGWLGVFFIFESSTYRTFASGSMGYISGNIFYYGIRGLLIGFITLVILSLASQRKSA